MDSTYGRFLEWNKIRVLAPELSCQVWRRSQGNSLHWAPTPCQAPWIILSFSPTAVLWLKHDANTFLWHLFYPYLVFTFFCLALCTERAAGSLVCCQYKAQEGGGRMGGDRSPGLSVPSLPAHLSYVPCPSSLFLQPQCLPGGLLLTARFLSPFW